MTSIDPSQPIQTVKEKALPYLLLFMMGAAWGLVVSLHKIATGAGAHPVGLALWQVAVGGSVLLVITTVIARPRRIRLDVVRFSFICGAIGTAVPSICLAWAARELPAGVVSIGLTLMPASVYGLAVLMKVEAPEKRRLSGLVLGIIGIALIVLPKTALPDASKAIYVGLIVFAAFCFSIESVYAGGYRPPNVSSMQLTCGRQFAAVTLLTPVALYTGTAIPVFVEWGPMQYMATGAGLLTAAAFSTWLYVINTAGPIFASQTSYLVTAFGLVWGIVLFDERHSLYVWASMAVLMVALTLVRPRAPKSRLLV